MEFYEIIIRNATLFSTVIFYNTQEPSKEVSVIYVVYADVLFLYYVLIHLALFFMVQTILGQTIRISRSILWAILTAAFSTGVFVITVHLCTLYYILYATSYFFMTYFFLKICKIKKSTVTILGTMLVACVWLAGMMQLFRISNQKVVQNPLFYAACVVSVGVCRRFRCLYEKKQSLRLQYEIELEFPETVIHAHAFVDTGNRLQNPYTKKPAIIINYRLLKNYVSESSYEKLEKYHKTGEFPYIQMNGMDKLSFFPLPYHTIGNHFSMMPAIMIPKVTYCAEQTSYYAVTAGISREPFFDNYYDVLLNEKLHPNKEETA